MEGGDSATNNLHNNLTNSQKCCLIVIDGWGISPCNDDKGDAIRLAKTPNMDYLTETYPNIPLEAHGRSVGLPTGLMGNSEVGHLNIGAGRVVFQDIVRIDIAIEDGSMRYNPSLVEAFKIATERKTKLHFVGLLSDGGVHSHIKHLKALLGYCKEHSDIPEPFIHAITDGRDTDPTSCMTYLTDLLDFTKDSYGKLATVIGRYYGMDRDNRWERTKVAHDALASGVGKKISSIENLFEEIKKSYSQDVKDEFLKPFIMADDSRITEGDVVIFFNFRSDRMRQLVQSLCLPPLTEQDSNVTIEPVSNIHALCMTSYNAAFPFPVISPPQKLDNVLAEWLSLHKIKQFHTAETEKYAHVTFFFNGGREAKFDGEERNLIASPPVATYDLQPEMSVSAVADSLIQSMSTGEFPFVMCNFAPPDMVGHTGKFNPTIKAVEATDVAIGRVYEACKANGYIFLVTADHGNAEMMIDPVSGKEFTAHTCNPVPFIVTTNEFAVVKPRDGREAALCDVAPTILHLLDIPPPPQMTGTSLLH